MPGRYLPRGTLQNKTRRKNQRPRSCRIKAQGFAKRKQPLNYNPALKFLGRNSQWMPQRCVGRALAVMPWPKNNCRRNGDVFSDGEEVADISRRLPRSRKFCPCGIRCRPVIRYTLFTSSWLFAGLGWSGAAMAWFLRPIVEFHAFKTLLCRPLITLTILPARHSNNVGGQNGRRLSCVVHADRK